MSAANGVSPSSSDRRGLRRLLLLSPSKPSAADRNPLIPPPPSSPLPPAAAGRRFGFAAAALRGLGCASASSSQAFAPAAAAAAAVRSSADWQGKRPRRSRGKKKKERWGQVSGGDVLWCAPGIPFAAEASVDCVVAHQPMVGRGRLDIAESIHREQPCHSRSIGHQEDISSFMDSPPDLDIPFFRHDLIPPGHLRHFRGYRTPGGLEEMIMFQSRVLMGGMDAYDRHRDWRLDVDNMSYEELLELGDRIGHVSTGLREDEIIRNLRKVKHSILGASTRQTATNIEWKCSICQEEYGVSDEVGRLACGHGYHVYCIKQWLVLKNACPVCKTVVSKT